ncbi:MAG TPA: tetratricopeptide repeat protein [bacterium]|jgi:predicted ATPase/class 3 adenylate cyclase|nr:tetratricopeptide repeat protein [bacterium]
MATRDPDPAGTLPAGTVTFLFADVEGSTRLLHRVGDQYPQTLEAFRAAMAAAITGAGGREIDAQGDAVFAAFSRAHDAVSAAVEAQRRIAAHPWPAGSAVHVRMGLHTGEPMVTGSGYVGMDVHRAARICQAGHGGQIVVSQTTVALIADDLPPGMELKPLGQHRLKDLTAPVRLFQIVAPGLADEFPPVRSLEARPNNLPAQLTTFVGRGAELSALRARLGASRLLTLTGAGGSGKTRLALQLAADRIDDFSDGVWWTDLAPLSDATLVAHAVAAALGVREQPGRPLEQSLLDYLRPKHLLLVLDNCEHLVAACAAVADLLLRHCPDMRMLATSREGLGIAGETLYPVPPMTLPDPGRAAPDDVAQYEAVQLFADRAAALVPSFAVTERTAPLIGHICRRLDGIPLALELAAARTRSLSLEAIAARLDDQFRLLTGGSRTALPRHQTLQSAIDWSYAMLGAAEQACFRRLSVFAGGFTLNAAEAVAGGDPVGAVVVVDVLGHLVDKSLVVAEGRNGDVRYRTLEPLRQYGRDRLLAAGEADAARTRHLQWCVTVSAQAEPALRGMGQADWLRRLSVEHDNLRMALQWALTSAAIDPGLRIATAIARFWYLRGHISEGRRWLDELLAAPAAPTVEAATVAGAMAAAAFLAQLQFDAARATALATQALEVFRDAHDHRGIAHSLGTLASVARWQANYERADTLFEESLGHYRAAGDTWGIASAIGGRAGVARMRRDYARAAALFAESNRLFRELGDQHGLSNSLYFMGLIARAQGDFAKAEALGEEGLAVSKALDDTYAVAHQLHLLGEVAWSRGDRDKAAALHETVLPMFVELGDKSCIISTTSDLALVAQHRGDAMRAGQLHRESVRQAQEMKDIPGIALYLERLAGLEHEVGRSTRAARLLGAADALRDQTKVSVPPADRTRYDGVLAAVKAAVGVPGFTTAWAEGRAMTQDQIIEFALAEPA